MYIYTYIYMCYVYTTPIPHCVQRTTACVYTCLCVHIYKHYPVEERFPARQICNDRPMYPDQFSAVEVHTCARIYIYVLYARLLYIYIYIYVYTHMYIYIDFLNVDTYT